MMDRVKDSSGEERYQRLARKLTGESMSSGSATLTQHQLGMAQGMSLTYNTNSSCDEARRDAAEPLDNVLNRTRLASRSIILSN